MKMKIKLWWKYSKPTPLGKFVTMLIAIGLIASIVSDLL